MIYLNYTFLLLSICCIRNVFSKNQFAKEWAMKIEDAEEKMIRDTAEMCGLACIGKVCFLIIIQNYN
jgi:hypothetical protein